VYFAVLLQALQEPLTVKWGILVVRELAFEGVLKCEVATILLTEDGSDDGTALLSKGVSCDVVGDSEEYEWMELNSKRRVRGFAGDERVRGRRLACHDGRCVGLRGDRRRQVDVGRRSW
jgi:hypothetical protein